MYPNGALFAYNKGMDRFEIPPGRFDLAAAVDDDIRRMAAAPPRIGDRAHPICAFAGALGGLGLKIADLSAALGLAFDRGPVLARCRLDFDAPLRTGCIYDVTAEVETLERKPSRSFGAADHLHLAIRLSDAHPRSLTRLHIIYPAEPA